MLRRYVFKFRNKWINVCVCIVLIICLAYYITSKRPNNTIYTRDNSRPLLEYCLLLTLLAKNHSDRNRNVNPC